MDDRHQLRFVDLLTDDPRAIGTQLRSAVLQTDDLRAIDPQLRSVVLQTDDLRVTGLTYDTRRQFA